MAAWVCRECSAVYAVGAPCCPHCRSTDYAEEGDMPKITRHGGPTVHVGGLAVSATWGDSPDPETAGAVTEPPASTAPAPDPSEEESCPGSSTPTSSEQQPPSSEPNETAPRPRARTMASRSKRARTATSSARGTDGAPEDTTSS